MSFFVLYENLDVTKQLVLEQIFTNPVMLELINELCINAKTKITEIDPSLADSNLAVEFRVGRNQLEFWTEIQMVIETILNKRSETTL